MIYEQVLALSKLTIWPMALSIHAVVLPSKRTHATLESLPPELVIKIADLCDFRTYHHMRLVCRYLAFNFKKSSPAERDVAAALLRMDAKFKAVRDIYLKAAPGGPGTTSSNDEPGMDAASSSIWADLDYHQMHRGFRTELDTVLEFEERHGVVLPLDYRRFLLEWGDGPVDQTSDVHEDKGDYPMDQSYYEPPAGPHSGLRPFTTRCCVMSHSVHHPACEADEDAWTAKTTIGTTRAKGKGKPRCRQITHCSFWAHCTGSARHREVVHDITALEARLAEVGPACDTLYTAPGIVLAYDVHELGATDYCLVVSGERKGSVYKVSKHPQWKELVRVEDSFVRWYEAWLDDALGLACGRVEAWSR